MSAERGFKGAMSEQDDTTATSAGDAIDLDTDPTTELDAAMQDALEAIETGRKSPDEARFGTAPPAAAAAADDAAPDLEAQLASQREKALRALADLENYRKRVQRERLEESRFKAFEPMRKFLAVVDNLERALDSEGSVEDLKQGVEMILRQMGNLLTDHGVERVQAIGQPFDPSVHEAVSREEDPNVRAPTVCEELQSGYTMHDRLLRPAVVKVSMPADPGNGGRRDDA